MQLYNKNKIYFIAMESDLLRKNCPKCRLPVTVSNSIRHTKCKHRTHGSCMGEPPNWATCAFCLGEVDLTTPMLPNEGEPPASNGHDYVAEPVPLHKRIQSALWNKNTKSVKPLIAEGPKKWPIDRIIREARVGLQGCLEQGVIMQDFLEAGYEWTDLQLFRDLSKEVSESRRLDALEALETSVGEICRLGIKVSIEDLEERFGLYFPDNGSPLFDFTGTEIIELGLKYNDLLQLGLCSEEQIDALQFTEREMRILGFPKAEEPQIERESLIRENPRPVYTESEVTVTKRRHFRLKKR